VVVQAGEEILVRSIRGRRGGWAGGWGPTPTARSATEPTPPRARPIEDAGTVAAVTGADAAKDGDSPFAGPLLTEEAADATLGLEPGRSDRGGRPTRT
jgi:hypothetical protein